MKKRSGSKVLRILLSFVLILPFFAEIIEVEAAVGGNGYDEINEAYKAGLSLQPVAPSFRLQTLMDWSPDTDPDAELNRSTVPLNKNRFMGKQINDLASTEAKITSAAIINSNHDESPSTGGSDFNIYAFNHWQYIDSLIYWAGTDEGIFAFPSPDIVDAAHQNGVPVYATLGFPWGSGNYESILEIQKMVVQDDNGSFPVGDKMIEMAEYYGFDGYFFNQETFGGDEKLATDLNELLRYIRSKSREKGYPLKISWYDAMDNSGLVFHQNAVNEKNDLWMIGKKDKPEAYGVDEFFMNYGWGGTTDGVERIEITKNHMKKIGRNPFDAYAGLELQQKSYKTPFHNVDSLLDENGKLKTSLALYAPNSTMGVSNDPADFHKHENILYTGYENDPSLSTDNKTWKGMSRYVVDKSVIQGESFNTNFNTGHGKVYFKEGNLVRNREWHNRSIQDLMPTWRWWIKDLVGTRLDASYDFSTAYNGGNSIKFSGELEKNSKNNIMLYSTKIEVKNGTKAELIYKNSKNVDIKLGLSFEEDYKDGKLTFIDLPKHGENWETAKIDLSQYDGKTIHAISVMIENQQETYVDMNLGGIKISGSRNENLSAPRNLKVVEQLDHNATISEARISWEKVDGADFYEIYQQNNDDKLELLGVSRNEIFYADYISRNKENAIEGDITKIVVKAIDKEKNTGKSSTVNFIWEQDLNSSEDLLTELPKNVALNATVTAVSHENPAEPASKALDGTSKGNSKWAATRKTDGYMEIKLADGPATVKRWRVEHAEFGGEDPVMNTVDFGLSYRSEDGKWKEIKRVKENDKAVTDIILENPVSAEEWRLDVYYAGKSAWQAVRIYEWQMFESDILPQPKNLFPSQIDYEIDDDNTGILQFNYVPSETEIKIYETIESEQPIQIIPGFKYGEKEKQELFGKTVLSEKIDFSQHEINDSGYSKLYYTITPKFSLESPKNSINIKLTQPEDVLLHVVDENQSGLNSTFQLIYPDGTIIETGAASESGLFVSLYPGVYKVKLTDIPRGYSAEEDYQFEVKRDVDNVHFIRVSRIASYDDLEKKIIEAGQLKSSLYTKDTFEEMLKMLETAKEIYQNADSSSEDYDTALNQLNKSIELLQELNWSGIEKHIRYREIINENSYNELELKDYLQSVDDAEIKLNERNQKDIDLLEVYLDGLLNSLEILEGNNDTFALESLLKEIETLDLNNFTRETASDLEEKINFSKIIIRDSKANKVKQTGVYDQYYILNDSKEKLEIEINIRELEAVLLKANGIDLGMYTENSVKNLTNTMFNASVMVEKAKNDMESVNQQEIDHLVDTLEKAIKDLKIKINLDKLNESIGEAKKIDKNKYTDESYTSMNVVLLDAETILSKVIEEEDVTQSQIDEIVEKLEFAMKSLIEEDSSNKEKKEPKPQEPKPEDSKPQEPKPKEPKPDKIKKGNKEVGKETGHEIKEGNVASQNGSSNNKIDSLPKTGMESNVKNVAPYALLIALGYLIKKKGIEKNIE